MADEVEFAVLTADSETARRVEEILGISTDGAPGAKWSEIALDITTNEPAVVRVTFLVDVDQAVEIAQLMRRIPTR